MIYTLQASLIIIQYGDFELLRRLLSSLGRHPDCALISEVIVVNNGNSLESNQIESLIKEPFPVKIKVVNNPKRSYSSGVNCGVSAAKEEVVIISNNDIEWLPDYSIQPLMECLKDPDVAVVGPQLVFPDGTYQGSYGVFPSIWSGIAYALMLTSVRPFLERRSFCRNKQIKRKVDWIVGAFMVIKKHIFMDLGGFDEDFPFYAEETDFCYRVKRAGKIVLFEPRSRLLHVGGASSKQIAPAEYMRLGLESGMRFMGKHYGLTQSHIYKVAIICGFWVRSRLYLLLSRLLRSRSQYLYKKYEIYNRVWYEAHSVDLSD